MNANRSTIALVLLIVLLVCQNALAFYNPQTGRWLSRDPIHETGGRNLCCMLNNDPQNYLDSLGTCSGGTAAAAYETGCDHPCKSSLEFKTSDPEAVGTKQELKDKCPGGQAACSKAEHSFESACEKCKDCRWRIVVDSKADCKIWYADPDKIPVSYPEGLDRVKKHEQCHCEDWQSALQDMMSFYDRASYASQESCEAAKASYDSTFERRLQERMRVSKAHTYGKYKPGGECYATGRLE